MQASAAKKGTAHTTQDLTSFHKYTQMAKNKPVLDMERLKEQLGKARQAGHANAAADLAVKEARSPPAPGLAKPLVDDGSVVDEHQETANFRMTEDNATENLKLQPEELRPARAGLEGHS